MFRMEIENRVMSKGVITVNIPIDVLFEKLDSDETLKALSPQIKENDTLHVVNMNGKIAKVSYIRYAGIWPVDDREVINVGMKMRG